MVCVPKRVAHPDFTDLHGSCWYLVLQLLRAIEKLLISFFVKTTRGKQDSKLHSTIYRHSQASPEQQTHDDEEATPRFNLEVAIT